MPMNASPLERENNGREKENVSCRVIMTILDYDQVEIVTC